MKVMFIYGTRPEAIKLAPVIKKMQSQPELFKVVICVTAQHREMLDQVHDIFGITPDYDLNIMQKSQSLYDVTIKGLKGLEKVLQKERPDLILVQGDTSTTFVGSLAAFYAKIPIGHVEAGLRTFDKYRPFPEEVNRRLTTHIADLHFAPTPKARENLLKENVHKNRIFVTGNTVIDALLSTVEKQTNISEQRKWKRFFKNYGISFNGKRRTILVTGHRRENFGQGFKNISEALREIALSHEDISIIYPVHLNPNVQEPAREILGEIQNIYLIPPLDYEPFIYLMRHTYLILTDSGGVQEEAPSLGKPVLVLRETTERPEAVEAGTVKIVGIDKKRIIENTDSLLRDISAYEAMSRSHNPYGDGQASQRIINCILRNRNFIE